MTFDPLKGVIAPNLTPFNDDYSIAMDLYVNHAQRLLGDGCVGLAPFGTTGEALSVGIEERKQALRALVDVGIDPKKLIPGTGLTNLPETAEFSRFCIELGCAGVMTLPPFYFKNVADQGLIDYYDWFIRAVDHTDLRIYLYHIPQVAGVGLPVSVVKTLFDKHPGVVVGIKDSSGDWENTAALLDMKDLIVYPGAELPLIEAMDAGGPGCISATANLNASGIAEVIRLHHLGQRDQAIVLHEKVKKFRQIVQGYAPIPAQKRLLALWSGDERWANVRPPLMPMASDKGQELADLLEKDLNFTGPEF